MRRYRAGLVLLVLVGLSVILGSRDDVVGQTLDTSGAGIDHLMPNGTFAVNGLLEFNGLKSPDDLNTRDPIGTPITNSPFDGNLWKHLQVQSLNRDKVTNDLWGLLHTFRPELNKDKVDDSIRKNKMELYDGYLKLLQAVASRSHDKARQGENE